MTRGAGVDRVELLAVPDVRGPGLRGEPLVDQRAAILARSVPRRVFGIGSRDGNELRPPAAEHHFDAVPALRSNQLRCDVGDACARGQVRVRFPVPIGRVCVIDGGRRFSDTRGRDDAGRSAGAAACSRMVVTACRRSPPRPFRCGRRPRRPYHAAPRLDAGDHRGRRGRGIGRLLRRAVGLRQGEEGQGSKESRCSSPLPPRAGLRGCALPYGRDAHAITDEQDHVARLALLIAGVRARHGRAPTDTRSAACGWRVPGHGRLRTWPRHEQEQGEETADRRHRWSRGPARLSGEGDTLPCRGVLRVRSPATAGGG